MKVETVNITDTTLRDGSHAVAHSFTPEQVRSVAAGLDHAGVDVIEVSHGDGLGGSSLQYGMSAYPEMELIEAAGEVIKTGRLAVLLLPGIGVKDDLATAYKAGARVARICTHCTEADICQQHVATAKDLGMQVVTFLMMAHMVSPSELVEQARLMEGYGADVVYVTDSAGALTPDGVSARVSALRGSLDCEVGIHAHNNLGLAVANSIAGVEAGATWVDGTTCGLGGGAGNTPTEVVVAVLEKLNHRTNADLYALMDVAEDVVRPMMTRPVVIDRAGLSLGYFGVYSSFLLHAERAATRFGVKTRDILAELGDRKVVGGQEDMILDVAAALADKSGARIAATKG